MNLHPVVERSIQKQHTRTAVNTLFQKQAESKFLAEKLAEFLASGGQIVAGQNSTPFERFNDENLARGKVEERRKKVAEKMRKPLPNTTNKSEKPIAAVMAGSDGMTIAEIMGAVGLAESTVRANIRSMLFKKKVCAVGMRDKMKVFALSKEQSND
jgi:hypothetical protein